jgi:hypothetical protein
MASGALTPTNTLINIIQAATPQTLVYSVASSVATFAPTIAGWNYSRCVYDMPSGHKQITCTDTFMATQDICGNGVMKGSETCELS